MNLRLLIFDSLFFPFLGLILCFVQFLEIIYMLVFLILLILMVLLLLAEVNFRIVLLLVQNMLWPLIIFSQSLFEKCVLIVFFIVVGLMTSPKVERRISVTQIFKLLSSCLLKSIYARARLCLVIACTL